MGKGHIRGAQPRPVNPDIFWVQSIDGGKQERYTIYSPQIWGVWTHHHYELKRTTPCYDTHKFCFGGHDPRTLRFKGYLFGYSFERHRNEFLQLTEAAVINLEEQLGPEVQLRGLTIDVKRSAKKQGRLYVSIADYIHRDPRTLPMDVSPRASLYNTWDIPDTGHKWSADPDRRLLIEGEIA